MRPLLLLACLLPAVFLEGHDRDAEVSSRPPLQAIDVVLRGLERFRVERRAFFLDDLTVFVQEELGQLAPGSPADLRNARLELLDGLCVLFDAEGILHERWLTRKLYKRIALDEEALRQRSSLGGWVSFHRRADGVRHFFLAAALTRAYGPAAAEIASRKKEFEDARRLEEHGTGEGFSFVDIAFDHGGILFTCDLLGWSGPISDVVAPVDAYLPDPATIGTSAGGLRTGIPWTEFRTEYLDDGWATYDAAIEEIEGAIRESVSSGQ